MSNDLNLGTQQESAEKAQEKLKEAAGILNDWLRIYTELNIISNEQAQSYKVATSPKSNKKTIERIMQHHEHLVEGGVYTEFNRKATPDLIEDFENAEERFIQAFEEGYNLS